MTIATSEVSFLTNLVAEKSGNVITTRQSYLLEQRLVPLANEIGLNDIHALVAELRKSHDPQLSNRVVEAVTVNETSFFRDHHVFDYLQKVLLPQIVSRNFMSRTIRIWCAACSTGQEPYSIGMILREHFPHLARWNIEILATDLSESVLAKCRSGQYTQLEVNRGLPVKLLVRHFQRQGPSWAAKDDLRSMIRTERLNLKTQVPRSTGFDLIMLRNVLIYFDSPTKSSILQRVSNCLSPTGSLFLGASETTLGMDVKLKRIDDNGIVKYQQNTR